MRALRFLTVLSVVAACAALAGAAAAAGGARKPAVAHASAVAGTATLAQVQPTSATGGSTVRSHGALPIPRSRRTGAPAAAAPRAASSPVLGASPLIANFNGVSSRDSAVTNFGQEFEPPDQGLCAGNGFVMEMVNSAYTVYRPNGSVVTGPFNVNGPFNEGLTQFTSDPRCYYDAATHTWFATILFISGGESASGNQSHLDIAVNPTGDPTKLWTNYQIDTTDLGGPGCPCFGDQPTLGIDAYNLYVTTNEFSINGPPFAFNGAQIYAISKKDLVSLSSAPHFVHFGHLSIGKTIAASVQPALTTGTPSAEYFLSSLDPTGTFDQRIGVWALTNVRSVSTGGTPTLSSIVAQSEAYGIPPPAEQRGSSSTLDSGDDRMQQTQFIGGNIWGELTTAITIGSSQRAGAAWFKVRPSLSGGVITKAGIPLQGYVAAQDRDFIYPALQVAPNGAAAIVGTLSGDTVFPSAAFTRLTPGSTSFGPVQIAAQGSTHYDPNATRWGDYSWAVLDPSGHSFWMATEYMPPASSQTADRASNWGTRVLNVATG